MKYGTEKPEHRQDLICFSHLRWNFVYQRPQHLLSRAARSRRVFFLEEPIFDGERSWLEISRLHAGLYLAVPHLPAAARDQADSLQRELLDELIVGHGLTNYVAWYYTPMALGFSAHL